MGLFYLRCLSEAMLLEQEERGGLEDLYMRDSGAIEMTEMVDITGDEIFDAGKDGSGQNGPIFCVKLDMRGDAANIGIADHGGPCNQGFQP